MSEVRVVLPSTLSLGSEAECWFDIGLQLVDKWGFHLPGHSAKLRLSLEGGSGEIPKEVEIRPEDNSHLRIKGSIHDRNKVYRVQARDLETGIKAVSNPAWVLENPDNEDLAIFNYKLFWGDMHAHRLEVPRQKIADPALWSQGPATVHEFYRFARDVVFLDFAALTDHDYTLTTDDYRRIQEGARYYNQPDRFVTLLGYEWSWNSGPDSDSGHRCVYFFDESMPLICGSWHGCNTAQDLFGLFSRLTRNGADIMTIPHHPARLCDQIWYNWESTDPRFERLMEVYSSLGSSEHQGEPFPLKFSDDQAQRKVFDRDWPTYEAAGHFVQDGLKMGMRFGFVADSESHDGRAGYPVICEDWKLKEHTAYYQGGITGVWSRRKTRECIWSSLWQRRTIAATGQRIFLYFDIDGQALGEIIRVTSPPKKMRVRAYGTSVIDRVEVVRNNQIWYTSQDPGWDCYFEITDLPMPSDGTDWYYIRVIQKDHNMAWSSPIWIEASS